MMNHSDDIGSWRSDVEIMSSDAPGDMAFSPEGQFILSSLLLRNSKTLATIPDDAQLMDAFEQKFANDWNLSINGTETHQLELFKSTIQPGSDLMRLWLFPRADVSDERNPQLTVSIVSITNENNDVNTLTYQLYVPDSTEELPSIYCQDDFVDEPRRIPGDWKKGHPVIPLDTGNVTHSGLLFSSSDNMREIVCGHPILKAAAQVLDYCESPTAARGNFTELSTRLAGRLKLNPGNVSFEQLNVAPAYPNKNPRTSQLILSRHDLARANNHTVLIVNVNDDADSVNFACSGKGMCPAYLPDIDPPNGELRNASRPDPANARQRLPDNAYDQAGGWVSIEPVLDTDLQGPVKFTVDVKSTSATMDYLLSRQQVLANLLLAYCSPLRLKLEDYNSELELPITNTRTYTDKALFDNQCHVAKNQLRIWEKPRLIRSENGTVTGTTTVDDSSAILLTVNQDDIDCAKTLEIDVYQPGNVNETYNTEFNVVDDTYPAEWFTSSLRIPFLTPSNNIAYSWFIGHLTTNTDLGRSHLTSRELIAIAGNNLIKLLTGAADHDSALIKYSGFPGKLINWIDRNKSNHRFTFGGQQNELILYPGRTPVFGLDMYVALIRVFDDPTYNRIPTLSFRYYKKQNIYPPPGKTNICS